MAATPRKTFSFAEGKVFALLVIYLWLDNREEIKKENIKKLERSLAPGRELIVYSFRFVIGRHICTTDRETGDQTPLPGTLVSLSTSLFPYNCNLICFFFSVWSTRLWDASTLQELKRDAKLSTRLERSRNCGMRWKRQKEKGVENAVCRENRGGKTLSTFGKCE